MGGSRGGHGRGTMIISEHIHNKHTVCNRMKNLKVTTRKDDLGPRGSSYFASQAQRIWSMRGWETGENQEESSNFVSLWAHYLNHSFLPISSNTKNGQLRTTILHLSFRAQRDERGRVRLDSVID